MNLSGSDLTTLRVFDAVARHKGFAAAQGELNIGATTISNHIRALEDRLGVRLCARGREGFRLTEQGEAVLAAARRLFAALDSFADDVADLGRQITGTLRIGLVDSVASDPNMRLSEAIARFKARPNSVTLEMAEDPPQALQEKLRGGLLHLGIGSFPHKLPGLRYEPLYTETHSLYCAPTHALFAVPDAEISMRRIRGEAIVGRGYWREEYARNLGFESPAAVVNQIEPQLILIRSGAYLGFLPDHVAARWVADGSLRALAPGKITYRCTFDLVTRKGVAPSRAAAAMLGAIRAAHGLAIA